MEAVHTGDMFVRRFKAQDQYVYNNPPRSVRMPKHRAPLQEQKAQFELVLNEVSYLSDVTDRIQRCITLARSEL
jgi:hypothetical protein